MRASLAILTGTFLVITPTWSESLAQKDPHSSGYAGPGYGATGGSRKQMKYVPNTGGASAGCRNWVTICYGQHGGKTCRKTCKN